MKRPSVNSSLFEQFLIAALGAGVVTTFAVAQGQSPLTALGITVFSGVAALVLGQFI